MRIAEDRLRVRKDVTSRLRGTYGLAVALTLLALCPDLVLSTGFLPLSTPLTQDLGTSLTWLQVTNGLSNAAFAAGVVVAAQLAQRFVQRRLFLGYAATFVVASALTAVAQSMPVFLAGRVLQGGTVGLMMISALPPLITRFGADRLPWSAAIVNIGLFGATTLGPLVCGIVAGSGTWRTLMWVITGLAALALAAAYLGYPVFDPVDPELRVDSPALVLTVVSTVLVFLATSLAAATSMSFWGFWTPLVVGIGALMLLIVLEWRRDHPLMPVRELSTQLPVTGTMVAMVAGATFVTAVELTQFYLAEVAGSSPTAAGRLLGTMPIGLVPAAVAFGFLFRTSLLPYLVNAGLLALAGGTALLLALDASGSTTVVPWAALLLGFGAGATVAPGLFLAGLGVRSQLLGRAFALVQLLRLTMTFAVGPVVLFLAKQQRTPVDGVHLGVEVTLALAVAGLVGAWAIPALSGARPHTPDLDAWLEGRDRGLESPVTAIHVRPGIEDDDAHDLIPDRLRRHD
jgi:MFS family permease